jgi:hypothetical protein
MAFLVKHFDFLLPRDIRKQVEVWINGQMLQHRLFVSN